MNVHLCIEKEDTKKAVAHKAQLPLKQVQSFFYLIPMKTTLSLILR